MKRNLYQNSKTGAISLKVRQEVFVQSEHLVFVVAHRLGFQPEFEANFNSRNVIMNEFKSWILEHGFTGDLSFDIERIAYDAKDIKRLLDIAKGIVSNYFPELFK